MRRHVIVPFLLVLADCRCRTQYEPEVTRQCMGWAADELEQRRDGGVVDLLEHKRLCEDCCRSRGFDAVDPGPCECGKLGVDVLLK